MTGREESRNERYRQIDKACTWMERWEEKNRDHRFPNYDAKKNVWYYGEGAGRQEDVYLDRLLQKFAGYEMRFRYNWQGEIVTRKMFAEVLEDMVTRYKGLSIEGFEDDYNSQQRKWLGLIREKLVELKSKRVSLYMDAGLMGMGKQSEE